MSPRLSLTRFLSKVSLRSKGPKNLDSSSISSNVSHQSYSSTSCISVSTAPTSLYAPSLTSIHGAPPTSPDAPFGSFDSVGTFSTILLTPSSEICTRGSHYGGIIYISPQSSPELSNVETDSTDSEAPIKFVLAPPSLPRTIFSIPLISLEEAQRRPDVKYRPEGFEMQEHTRHIRVGLW